MGRRALLLVNPKARRGGEDLAEIRARFTDGGLKLIEPDHVDGDAAAVIRRYQSDVDLVIVGGGDGSIHWFLSGLLESKLPLGVLPLGTANDFARTLGLPADPLEACDVILQGHQQSIDLGQVNGRPFLNVASIGVTSEVTRRLSRGAKTRWGVLAYVWAAMGAMFRSRSFSVNISCDNRTFRTRSWQIAVGNGRYYGGGMTIHENARIDDGLLDLYSLEMERGWQILLVLPALRHGKLDPALSVRTMHGTAIRIETPGRVKSIFADGEQVGQTPAEFSLLRGILKVFVPQRRVGDS